MESYRDNAAADAERRDAFDKLVRAGLIDQDGNPTPFYAPGNDDHMPHAFGSDTDGPDTEPDMASG